MEIRDFYESLIELASPWAVKAVAVKEESVDVYLECADTARFTCPHCECSYPACDCSPSKTWRHLDTCGKMTFLHAGLPVVDCPEHGKQHPRIPWAEEGLSHDPRRSKNGSSGWRRSFVIRRALIRGVQRFSFAGSSARRLATPPAGGP